MTHQKKDISHVKGLVFDVFGTCVDWRTPIEAALRQAFHDVSSKPSSAEFAQRWREGYVRTLSSLGLGSQQQHLDPYPDLDTIHRQLLDDLLDHEFKIPNVDDATRDALTMAWHKLTPWPDTNDGLTRLSQGGFITSTLSNGSMRLLVDLKKHGQMPFDMLLSSELFATYKPNPRIYHGGAALLGLKCEQVALVAAHIRDLQAAKACGLATIYVPRPGEEDTENVDLEGADMVVKDFAHLADLLVGR